MKNLIFIATTLILTQVCYAQLQFNSSVQTLDASGYECAIADLNNDSFPDIYISGHFGGTSAGHPGYIWMNNGDGSFIAKQTIGYPAVTHRVAFADLDGDDDTDLFLANDASYTGVAGANPEYYTGCPNEVWFNDGLGNFTNSGQLLGHEPSNKVELVDIDNDNDIDAVIGNYHPGNDLTWSNYKPDEIWLNNGSGIFTLKQSFGYGMGYPMLVDLDNDGDLDALVQDTLWNNNGNGMFSKSSSVFAFGNNVNACQFGDLNNDGKVDVFIGNWDTPAEIWLNDENNNLVNSNQQLGKQKCNNINLIDIDNDEDLDAFTDNDGGRCKLWINQGGKQNGTYGIFEDSNLELPNGKGILYDFNKDGKQDALISNKIYINEYVATYVNDIKSLQVHVFPNPTSQTIQIKGIDLPLNNTNYHLTDLNGRTIKQGILTTKTIDISELSKGVYLFSLNTGKGVITEKIIIE